MDIEAVFKARARKYNHYHGCAETKGRRCIDCIRWRLSYPYACKEHDMYGEKAETCLNYTTDPKCPVD